LADREGVLLVRCPWVVHRGQSVAGVHLKSLQSWKRLLVSTEEVKNIKPLSASSPLQPFRALEWVQAPEQKRLASIEEVKNMKLPSASSPLQLFLALEWAQAPEQV